MKNPIDPDFVMVELLSLDGLKRREIKDRHYGQFNRAIRTAIMLPLKFTSEETVPAAPRIRQRIYEIYDCYFEDHIGMMKFVYREVYNETNS